MIKPPAVFAENKEKEENGEKNHKQADFPHNIAGFFTKFFHGFIRFKA